MIATYHRVIGVPRTTRLLPPALIDCDGRPGRETVRLAKHTTIPPNTRSRESTREAPGSLWPYLWALGDALVVECRAPGEDGIRTGSDERIRQAAKVLKTNGVDYSFEHLRELRRVAAAFSAGERSPALAWSIHNAAGTPENLKKVLRYAETHPKFKVTARSVEAFLRNKPPKTDDGPERDRAREDFIDAAVRAQELPDYAEGRISDYVDGLSKSERDELFVEATKAADRSDKWRKIATRFGPPTEIQEAAE